jgi:hypothetical protein
MFADRKGSIIRKNFHLDPCPSTASILNGSIEGQIEETSWLV